MLNHSALRSRLAPLHTTLLALAFTAATHTAAHASTLSLSSGCSASGYSLKCRLGEFLGLLYVAAGVLGLVLIIVVILAVHSYRASKKGDNTGS